MTYTASRWRDTPDGFKQEMMVGAFINITDKNNHIRTRVNSAPVTSHLRQRMMVEPEIPTSERY